MIVIPQGMQISWKRHALALPNSLTGCAISTGPHEVGAAPLAPRHRRLEMVRNMFVVIQVSDIAPARHAHAFVVGAGLLADFPRQVDEWIRGSLNATTAAVSSVQWSPTTMSSQSASVECRTLSIAWASTRLRLYVARTTDTTGVVDIRVGSPTGRPSAKQTITRR